MFIKLLAVIVAATIVPLASSERSSAAPQLSLVQAAPASVAPAPVKKKVHKKHKRLKLKAKAKPRPPRPVQEATDQRAVWTAIAGCESGGDWKLSTGNGFFGGLQFTYSSWLMARGARFAPRADLATPDQQMLTADVLRDLQGYGAWPVCRRAAGV